MSANWFFKILNSRVSPMVYVMMGISLFIGVCFATALFLGVTESVLYSSGVLFDPQAWGAVLSVTSALCLYGFWHGDDRLVSIGGMGGFICWLFATISVFMLGHWYILVTVTLFHLIFHIYVVLASSLGYLRRAPLETRDLTSP